MLQHWALLSQQLRSAYERKEVESVLQIQRRRNVVASKDRHVIGERKTQERSVRALNEL